MRARASHQALAVPAETASGLIPSGFDPSRGAVTKNPPNPMARIRTLDAISRQRALTEAESIQLERLLWRVEKKTAKRASYGSNKVLARAGIERRAP